MGGLAPCSACAACGMKAPACSNSCASLCLFDILSALYCPRCSPVDSSCMVNAGSSGGQQFVISLQAAVSAEPARHFKRCQPLNAVMIGLCSAACFCHCYAQ